MYVDVITRVTRPAPTDTHHYGIVLHNQGRCAEEKKIKTRSLVTMNTTARIPNCKFVSFYCNQCHQYYFPVIYLKYTDQFPESNVSTKIGEKGALGVKIDESVDTVRAGVDQMIEGWDRGIAGACEGESRKIKKYATGKSILVVFDDMIKILLLIKFLYFILNLS